eukprot:CAMPEP_0185792124 /NCGR_PEP_ID=MMETSP1174-20130828/158755_1 /TAXON_ID=35687 /ORGANISM="Dictyocha speculum, Strain CCMP1381" /LENGTH=167 /DNA_ID=CAMNT_0028487147 /DNA_START=442 /DNA_END=945 /DNA_ORIENTATION=+
MAAMFGFHAINQRFLEALTRKKTHLEGGSVIGDQAPNGILSQALIAALVGVEASIILAPLELVRIQGQNRGKGELVAASRYVVSEIGVSGLVKRGMAACMHRESKYCIGQFFLIGLVSERLTSVGIFGDTSNELRTLVASLSAGDGCVYAPGEQVLHRAVFSDWVGQ